MSWRAQANRMAFHLECDRQFAADIKKLTQLAKETDLVTKMWGNLPLGRVLAMSDGKYKSCFISPTIVLNASWNRYCMLIRGKQFQRWANERFFA